MTNLTSLTGTWTVDPAHSTLGFVARHAMITKVRGSIGDFEATARINGDDLAASSVEVTMQAAAIDTGNAGRDEHLRSADFFDTEQHPTWTFRSTSVAPSGADTVDVTGDLTIKGVTRPVTIPLELTGVAKDPFGNERAGFEGRVKIKRSDFGLTWNAALETGGVLVSDDIQLELELSAIRA